jgi:hypothetical protein
MNHINYTKKQHAEIRGIPVSLNATRNAGEHIPPPEKQQQQNKRKQTLTTRLMQATTFASNSSVCISIRFWYTATICRSFLSWIAGPSGVMALPLSCVDSLKRVDIPRPDFMRCSLLQCNSHNSRTLNMELQRHGTRQCGAH